MRAEEARCARCGIEVSDRLCQAQDGKAPGFCPTSQQDRAIQSALQELEHSEVAEFARLASIQEGEGYAGRERGYEHVRPVKPRIQETIEFAHKMGYQRLGLVFCVGLREEARLLEKLLTSHGFDVVSAVCKLGRVPKETIGVRDDEKIRVGAFEPMCNPIAQARVLNQAETEFNVVVGLCVGHDALFLRHSAAPCTVLAVKDRVLGHNPLAALYTLNSYYRALKAPADPSGD
jgi:uncharacterized metal-binding protein